MKVKNVLKACAIIGTCIVLFSANAFAEQQATHDSLWSENATHDSLWRETATPELGDHSVATVTLASLSALTLVGAIIAHKKVRSNAL